MYMYFATGLLYYLSCRMDIISSRAFGLLGLRIKLLTYFSLSKSYSLALFSFILNNSIDFLARLDEVQEELSY